MAFTRVSMRKIREILRLHFEAGLKHRQIARSCHSSHPTVAKYVEAAEGAGLTWPLPEELADDEALYSRLFPASTCPAEPSRPLPEWTAIHDQLSAKGMTLQLLWEEYRQDHPEGYGYTQFCDYYRRWKSTVDVVLRHTYTAGEKTFVDWAGLTIPWLDGLGHQQQAHLFVAILAVSNYTYAEAFDTTQQWHWIDGHVHAFEYFGGVTQVVVPDNERTGVTRACRYEPDLNPTYQRLAAHYGTVVIPARPHAPRDKAKVEAAVQHAERRLIAPLRHQTFFSVADVNAALRPLLEQLNTRPFQKLPGSRRQRFEELERPALRPLPASPYELDDWGKAKANIDYHVQVDRNFYSVPYTLVHQVIEVRQTARAVELFHKGRRVAAHQCCYGRGQYVTDPGHRPKAHARHLDWTPGRLIAWAADVGPQCAQLVRTLLDTKPHPEQGYRACLGIMRLAKRHGTKRTEAASARALALESPSFQTVNAILKHGTEADPLPGQLLLKPLQTPARVGVDVAPTEPHRGTTLGASLEPVLHALGQTGWSQAKLQGVLGHLFHFQMAEGGDVVYHDNLDWSIALRMLKEVASWKPEKTARRGSAQRRSGRHERASVKPWRAACLPCPGVRTRWSRSGPAIPPARPSAGG